MKKLNFLGIGPRIAVGALPVLAATIILSVKYPEPFRYTVAGKGVLTWAGIILLTAGFVFYFSTVRLLLKGLRETRLITSGPYSLCRNPLYTSIILLIIPGLSLLLNSWLILLASLVMWILFTLYIGREYAEMEEFFGEKYKSYAARTPGFFPRIPAKKHNQR